MNQNYRMIDVGNKEVTKRRAVAKGTIVLSDVTMDLIRKRQSPKGDILSIAEVAGIMAAKNTAGFLPLCHPLLLDSVRIWFEILDKKVECFCEVICHAKTGVEMEALVGLNAALLTIYDLAKAVDPVIEIESMFLQRKEGGKSGVWQHPREVSDSENTKLAAKKHFAGLRFAVGTLSDRASQGVYEDKSGELLRLLSSDQGGTEALYKVIPDDPLALKNLVLGASEEKVDVLLLTGGTGLSERDITPETVRALASKELSGFGELQRQHGAQYTKSSWLSRSSAFVVNGMLVVLFPGSPRAVQQGMECLVEIIPHAIKMIRGESHGGTK